MNISILNLHGHTGTFMMEGSMLEAQTLLKEEIDVNDGTGN